MLTVLFCFVFPQLYMFLAVRRISKLRIVDNIIISLQLVLHMRAACCSPGHTVCNLSVADMD